MLLAPVPMISHEERQSQSRVHVHYDAPNGLRNQPQAPAPEKPDRTQLLLLRPDLRTTQGPLAVRPLQEGKLTDRTSIPLP